MSLLKPCPLCGGEAKLVDNRLSWYVRCTDCEVTVVGSQVPELTSAADVDRYDWDVIRQSAIAKWNSRITPWSMKRDTPATYIDPAGVVRHLRPNEFYMGDSK